MPPWDAGLTQLLAYDSNELKSADQSDQFDSSKNNSKQLVCSGMACKQIRSIEEMLVWDAL